MRSIRTELLTLNVPFVELPPYDWNGSKASIRDSLRVASTKNDTWLIGWAHSQVIEYIKHKQGRKYGLVVGVMAGHFDPLNMRINTKVLCERERLSQYDGLFAVSRWCRDCLIRAYPEFADKVAVTGFPLDFTAYEPYQGRAKEPGLVVFNQRFSHERLPQLELEAAAILSCKGYRVRHLSGSTRKQITRRSPSLGPLLAQAENYGLEFCVNHTKDAYLKNLAMAEVVITTSIADTLSVAMIEAVLLGAVPVAPRAFCFPEYIHSENLYTPYDLAEITGIVQEKPLQKHTIAQYSKEQVIRNMLLGMQLDSNS